MLEQLQSAAAHIREMNEKTRGTAKNLRNSSMIFPQAMERDLIKKVEKKEINKRIAAVDGGLLFQEMHGVDLVVGKAAAAEFVYKEGKLSEYRHYPDPFPKPSYAIETGLDEMESNSFRSLFRLSLEIDCAVGTAEELKPDVIFLDGSIVPLPSDKPQEGSSVYSKYLEVLEKYKKLYKKCEEENIILAGIIKDSRGRRFLDSIKSAVPVKSSDTVFLNHLLEKGERTFAVKYTENSSRHPVMRDLKEWGDKIAVLYIKSVEEDKPLRVEFLSSNVQYDEMASLVYTLSSINKTYGYPAVLIEADLRAMMDPKEMERMQKTLQMLYSSDFRPLRRNNRPFR
ncbi:DNA double-strand break repair nuclease NurA [Candidatus Micrarchaeota archaeon]|nr:DNA double-strand break repair nuclease NurA [Candidatus Micrarchaeota archaeon]